MLKVSIRFVAYLAVSYLDFLSLIYIVATADDKPYIPGSVWGHGMNRARYH